MTGSMTPLRQRMLDDMKLRNMAVSTRKIYARISHLDPADTPEGRGNAGETADSFFHPSRPSGLGYLIQRKSLICQPELVGAAGRMPIHLENPGLKVVRPMPTVPPELCLASLGRIGC